LYEKRQIVDVKKKNHEEERKEVCGEKNQGERHKFNLMDLSVRSLLDIPKD